MLPFKSMIILDPQSRMPLYIQITNAIIHQILAGKIVSTFKLPGTRTLAELLGVHRKTVVMAYEELEAQGWIDSIEAKGSFVSSKLPVYSKLENTKIKPPKVSLKKSCFHFKSNVKPKFQQNKVTDYSAYDYTFDDGNPDIRLAPIKELGMHYRSFLNTPKAYQYLNYSDKLKGDIMLRQELMKYLSESRSIHVGVENIMITRGSVNAMFLIFQLLLQDGGNVIVGDTNFKTANQIIEYSGGQIIRVKVDQWGINTKQIEKICQEKEIRAVYIIPHHHHPTTVSLCADRRMKLMMLAEQYKFAILEDDYDYDFHYQSAPILPLASNSNFGMVLYVGSFSKSIAPAFRIGFAVGPEDFIDEMSYLRRYVDRQGDRLLERSIAILFQEGEIRRHLRKAQKVYHRRRDHLCELLSTELKSHLTFDPPEGGLAAWVHFNPDIDLKLVASKAAQKGLYLIDSSNYRSPRSKSNATRMGFASMNRKETTAGIKILKKIIRSI